jgi:hypothetical protein
MPVLSKGTTFATGDAPTATTLNNLVDNATFASGSVDDATTQLSSGAIIVKDGGITTAKLSTGGPTWTSGGALTATSIQNTPIGSSTASTGAFTTLSATGTTSIYEVLEKASITATSLTGTVNFNALDGAVLYCTSNASGNWTLNVRGNGSTTLNNVMATGDSLSLAVLVTQGSTAYYQSAFQIDGSGVTPKWAGGTAPTAGNASSVDVYTITIFKTGSAAFTVFASQTKFA